MSIIEKCNIRIAELLDLEPLNRLKNQVHSFHVQKRPDFFKASNTSLPESYFASLLASDQYNVFIVESAELIVAYAITKTVSYGHNPLIVDHQRLFVEDICVDENFRSKGIGSGLFNFLEDFCKDHDIGYLSLDVWGFNEKAIEFYRMIGMEPVIHRFEKEVGTNENRGF